MASLSSIYVFIPDISIFEDAFVLSPKNDYQKSAKEFINFITQESERTGYFFLRTPVNFTVRLLNEDFLDDEEIWGVLSLILRVENVTDEKDISLEKEIVECYNFLRKFKKPLILCNRDKKEYEGLDVISTNEFMKLKDVFLSDRPIFDISKHPKE